MTRSPRQLLFLTGTRADFGKLKPLIHQVEAAEDFECTVFATGMHTLRLYGDTICEVRNAGFQRLHVYQNQILNEPMDLVLANTITGLARFVSETATDLIVVHGDRIEAMAGAMVGCLRNVLVAHVEGGELSGTVDDSLRHAISKLAHLHFVANQPAASRLEQLGEQPESIFIIGSPDIDIMAADDLPSIAAARQRYQITAPRYAIALFHPVTTEVEQLQAHTEQFIAALLASGDHFVVIYPNNDQGASTIIDQYNHLRHHPNFRIFPSIRFEYFLTLLKNADYIVGNSSAGIREAPFYGCPAVDVGTRQNRRHRSELVIPSDYRCEAIVAGIGQARARGRGEASDAFGRGNSRALFLQALRSESLWHTPQQKQFREVPQGLAGDGT